MKARKKQFKQRKDKPVIFDRKVQRTGTSVVLSLTKILPKAWIYVRIKPVTVEPGVLILEVTPLWTVEDNARSIEAHKTGEQNA